MTSLIAKTEPTLRFLLVEDDDDHARIVIRTMTKYSPANQIDRVNDGEKALRWLRREGEYKNCLVPDIILLDLKLPKKDGLEVLAEIKADEKLRAIPVVVLTTSDAEPDKRRAYQLHANSYLVKPLDAATFKKMLEDVGLYWRLWNRLPQKENP